MKLTETKDGTIIEIYVKPNSTKFEVNIEDDEIVVRSTEEPEKGKVNKEILKELSKLPGDVQAQLPGQAVQGALFFGDVIVVRAVFVVVENQGEGVTVGAGPQRRIGAIAALTVFFEVVGFEGGQDFGGSAFIESHETVPFWQIRAAG